MAASVWMKSWMLRSLALGRARLRPLALMMPEVTVKVRFSPSGLPTARTHSPTRLASLLPSGAGVRWSASILSTARSVSGIGAHDLGLELPAVEQAHRHLVGVVHHVVVGQDVAVRGDDEARARGLLELGRLHLRKLRGRTARTPEAPAAAGGCRRRRRPARPSYPTYVHHAGLDLFRHRGERLAQRLDPLHRGRDRLRDRGLRRRLALGLAVPGEVQRAGGDQAAGKGEHETGRGGTPGTEKRHNRLLLKVRGSPESNARTAGRVARNQPCLRYVFWPSSGPGRPGRRFTRCWRS